MIPLWIALDWDQRSKSKEKEPSNLGLFLPFGQYSNEFIESTNCHATNCRDCHAPDWVKKKAAFKCLYFMVPLYAYFLQLDFKLFYQVN